MEEVTYALETLRDCGDRPGMYEDGKIVLEHAATVQAELQRLYEQIGALTSERDLAMKAHHEALVAHGYEKQQKHRIEHEKARLQEQIDELETRARGDLATIDSQQGEITQLEEQVEALQQKLVKTRTEAEEYRELWHNAEG